MTKAAEIFKEAWNKRDQEWNDTFEDVDGYGHFQPTEPSERTEAGLNAVVRWILNEGYNAPEGSQIDDPETGVIYAEGAIWATRMMRGAFE